PHFFVQHRAQRLVFVPYGGYDFCIRHNGSWLSVSKGRSLQGDSEASSQRLYCPLPRMPCILVQSTRHSSIGEDNSNINLEKLFCDSALIVHLLAEKAGSESPGVGPERSHSGTARAWRGAASWS